MHDSYSKLNFQHLFENLPGSYIVLSPELKIIAVTDEYLKSTFRKTEDLIGQNIFEVFTNNPDDIEHSKEVRNSLEKVLQTGEPDELPVQKYDVERPIDLGGGFEERYWSLKTFPGFDEGGNVAYVVHHVEDITRRIKNEQILLESKDRYHLISRATNDAIWDWNLETDQVWWNEGVKTIFGYAENEIENTSKWWYEHIHSSDRDRVIDGIHEVIDKGEENWSDEYRFLKADGGFKYVFDRGFVLHRHGRPVRMLGAMQDITTRKKAVAENLKSQERLQIVLETSKLGLWYCDLPFDVLNWSDTTKEHFWFEPDDVINIDLFYERLHPEDREPTRKAIDSSIEDQTQYDIEYRTVNPVTGKIKWIRAIGRGFYDESNNPQRFDGITIDVTDNKLIETERESLLWREKNARAEAETANRLKDEFLATLSHELRTPLTSILGWSRMLATDQLKGEQLKRAISAIERNAKSQSQLIEDILDVSRIISGKMRLTVRPVDLTEVIESAIDSVRPAADAKEIKIQRVLDSEVGLISGDSDRLQQIIWNLLSNAIKFTPKDGRVQIKLERVNSHVEVTVSDDGSGIDEETLPHIFERFRQSDSSSTRTYGGLGLGLAIVRHLVEQHGGVVNAASDGIGRGAVFTISFPLSVARSDLKTQNEERIYQTFDDTVEFSCPPELNNLRILVVDDEADTRALLSSIFESCNANIKGVASVDEAIAALENEKFDILISDIGMPNKSGYDLMEKLRKFPPQQNGTIPAVALTAYAGVEDRMRTLSAGFQMHIPKPIEPAKLIMIITSLMNRNNS